MGCPRRRGHWHVGLLGSRRARLSWAGVGKGRIGLGWEVRWRLLRWVLVCVCVCVRAEGAKRAWWEREDTRVRVVNAGQHETSQESKNRYVPVQLTAIYSLTTDRQMSGSGGPPSTSTLTPHHRPSSHPPPASDRVRLTLPTNPSHHARATKKKITRKKKNSPSP
jgi:hypothetical protein